MSRLDIYNVIGTIYGKEEPDRWVLIGNHRDAWGFGAVDASSGTSSVMEISRGLKALLEIGWRSRRTIKFCSWGAEEAGLIGSTEWVEEHEKSLLSKAIMYINVDIAVQGNFSLDSFGSPLLETFAFEETKKVDDLHGKTVYDRWLKTDPSKRDKSRPDFGKVDAGSDYGSLYHFTGVPSIDLCYYFFNYTFYPVYHTIHDNFQWLQGLVDPNFVFHLTTTRVAARLLLNAADKLVLPFDVSRISAALNESLELLENSYGAKLRGKNITLSFIENAVEKFQKAAERFKREVKNAMEQKHEIALRALNNRMVDVEKAFIYSKGLPGRPQKRHVLFAPAVNNRYAATSFPGISEILDQGAQTEEDWQDIKMQVSVIYRAILEAVEVLQGDAI